MPTGVHRPPPAPPAPLLPGNLPCTTGQLERASTLHAPYYAPHYGPAVLHGLLYFHGVLALPEGCTAVGCAHASILTWWRMLRSLRSFNFAHPGGNFHGKGTPGQACRGAPLLC